MITKLKMKCVNVIKELTDLSSLVWFNIIITYVITQEAINNQIETIKKQNYDHLPSFYYLLMLVVDSPKIGEWMLIWKWNPFAFILLDPSYSQSCRPDAYAFSPYYPCCCFNVMGNTWLGVDILAKWYNLFLSYFVEYKLKLLVV